MRLFVVLCAGLYRVAGDEDDTARDSMVLGVYSSRGEAERLAVEWVPSPNWTEAETWVEEAQLDMPMSHAPSAEEFDLLGAIPTTMHLC